MEYVMIQQAADRVRRMEQCFDTLLDAAQNHPASLLEDSACIALLRHLTRYYESGQWLRDYELDEQGLLPRDLKRGVLSQDGVYDLLARVRELERSAGIGPEDGQPADSF